MVSVPASLREVIESGPLVHLSTTNRDGRPQVSLIWVGFDGDDLVSGHLGSKTKIDNVGRQPHVVLSFLAPGEPAEFLHPYAILHATAQIVEDADGSFAAWELLDRLTPVYLGAGTAFPAPRAAGTILRYRIDRVGGVGPWAPSHH